MTCIYSVAARWVPEEEAGAWSQMFFSYATGLIKLGKQKALRPDDLWDISHRDQASNVSQVMVALRTHHTNLTAAAAAYFVVAEPGFARNMYEHCLFQQSCTVLSAMLELVTLVMLMSRHTILYMA